MTSQKPNIIHMPPSHFVKFRVSVLAAILPVFGYTTALAAGSDAEACGFSANVQFLEGAPRDRFIISNTSTHNWMLENVILDLSTSAGRLIFDVTADGAGVEVFQPFKSEASQVDLLNDPVVDDGDQKISLSFESFGPGTDYTFSIDVDDQLSNSDLGQIRVAGSEIAGAMLTMVIENEAAESIRLSGTFDEQSQALLTADNCTKL